MRPPAFLLVDPAHFEVAYTINPWMQPGAWGADPAGSRRAARIAFSNLVAALKGAGAEVEIMPGVPGAPDLVFPANAGVVLDGRATLARFRHPERQVEEPHFQRAFQRLRAGGLLEEILVLSDGCLQEGAGDFIWHAARGHVWAGYGPRTNRKGLDAVAEFFGREVVALELATERFYHLDTCFCPLPGGEVLYYPPAFTAEGLRRIRTVVPACDLIEATDDDAARFCVNAVAFDRIIIMAEASDQLKGRLGERGYRVIDVGLDPFILSGGGAYCMTLRLDNVSAPATAPAFGLPAFGLKEPAE